MLRPYWGSTGGVEVWGRHWEVSALEPGKLLEAEQEQEQEEEGREGAPPVFASLAPGQG